MSYTNSRRYSLMISYFFQAFWIYVLAGVGGMAHKTSTQKNVVVAAFMLFSTSYNVGVEQNSAWELY